MKRLHDYLDESWIRVTCKNGHVYEGRPISVEYADETETGEEEITIENEKMEWPIIGFALSEIASIEVI